MRIVSVEARPILGKTDPTRTIVSSLGDHAVGQYVLVEIATDTGEKGLGEASVTAVWSGETQAGAIALVETVLAPALVGADPFDLDWICRRMSKLAWGNPFIRAAIEMALLDLQGRHLGIAVRQLLGGTRPQADPIRLKFVIGAVSAPLAAERAAAMVAAGWTALKVKVGTTGDPKEDFARLAAVRQATGPNIWLSVDANGAFNVADAVWLGRRLEKLDVALFEQPTPRGDHRQMRRTRARIGIPVMADESVFGLSDALEILRCQCADILSIYPGKAGGLQAASRIAAVAESEGVPCTIGSNLEREIATAAMAQLVAANGNLRCDRYPGDLIGPLYFEQCLTAEPLRYAADRLYLPCGTGLGVTLSRSTSS